MKRRLRHARIMSWIMLVVTAPGLIVNPAMAATKYWDGGGANVNWNTAANWDGPDILPANDSSVSGDTATFNQGSYTRQPTMNVAWGIRGLSFGASSAAITITAGNTLTIGDSGITVDAGGPAHTINSTISLGASQTWANNDDSLLTIGGGISLANTGAQTLTVGGTGSGGVTLGGVLSNGSGTLGLAKTGTGTLILSSGSSTYSGGVTLNSGTIIAGANTTGSVTSGPFGTGTLTLSGGKFLHTNTGGLGTALTIANAININGNTTLEVNQSGNNRSATFSGTTTFASGLTTLTINNVSGGSNGNNGWTFSNPTFNQDFTLAGNTNVTLNQDSIVFGSSGGTITWTSARMITFSNTSTTAGMLTNVFRGTLAGSGGALTIAGTAPVTWGDATAAITGSSASGGVIFNGPTITASGASTYTGGTRLSSGTLALAASSTPNIGPLFTGGTGPLGVGTLTINGASTIKTFSTAAYTLANDLTINTSGTVNFGVASGGANMTFNGQNQSIAGGPTLNFIANTTTFGYYPMALNSSATISNASNGSVAFNGGLTVASGGTKTLTLNHTTTGTVTIAGPLTLNDSLTFTGTRTGSLTLAGVTMLTVPYVNGSTPRTLFFNDASASSAATFASTTGGTGVLLLNEDFSLTGNATRKPTVYINGIRVPTGKSSTFTIDNDNIANPTTMFGTLDANGKDWILGGNVTLSYNATGTAMSLGPTGNYGFIIGAGNLTFANGTTTFAGTINNGRAHLYTGTITIGSTGNATTVKAGGTTNGMPLYGNLTLANTPGTTQTFDLNNLDQQIADLTGGGNAVVTNTGAAVKTLTVGNLLSNTSSTYSGIFTATTPANLALKKVGGGTLTLNGSAASTFRGAVTVAGGNLVVDLSNMATPTNLLPANALYCWGGTFTLTGKPGVGVFSSQALDVPYGDNSVANSTSIIVGKNGGDGTYLALGSFYKNSFGRTWDFTLPGGTQNASNGISILRINSNSIVGPWATVGSADWAVSGTTLVTGIAWVNATDRINQAGRTDGSQVIFGTVPGGLAANTTYYVVNATATDFQVAATPGGAVILLTNDGTTATVYTPGNITALNNTLNTAETGWSSATANYSNNETGTTVLTASRTANTLRFIGAGARTIDLSTAAVAQNLTVGGILNATGNLLTIQRTAGSGTLVLLAGAETILIGAAWNDIAISAPISGTILTKAGANTLTLSGANTYTGATYINEGTLVVTSNANLGAPASAGTLYLNKGATLRADATFVMDNAGANKRPVTIGAGGATIEVPGSNVLTISGVITAGDGALTKTGTGTLTLSGANSFVGGVAPFILSRGQLNINNAAAFGNQSLFVIGGTGNAVTLDNTSGSAITVATSGTSMRWNDDFTFVGSSNLTFNQAYANGNVLLGGNRQVTVSANTFQVDGAIHDGGKNYSLTKAGNGTLALTSAYSTYSGGTTLSAGTLALGASSTGTSLSGNDPAPGVVYGPLGTGTLTLNGGVLRSTAATTGGDRTIHNTLAIDGNVTLGDLVNNGSLTFRGASQTIAAGSTITALSAVTFGSGLVTDGNVAFAGPGAVTILRSITDPTPDAMVIGDGTTYSGNLVGSAVSVGSQAALGSGTVTINYGGTLTQSASFNPSNTMTVNAGGTANLRGAPSGLVTINSGATIGGVGAAMTLTSGANLVLPTKGFLFNNSTTASTISGAYPSLTGTLAFGGTGTANLTTGAATTLSDTPVADKTLAFNQSGGGAMVFNGLILNANLTVAGSGNTGLTGMVPTGAAGSLGAISGGNNITVAMAPTGMVQVNANATGWANTTINSGTLFVTGASGVSVGSGTLTINGGTLRYDTSISGKNISVGANGGALECGEVNLDWSGVISGGAAGLPDLILRGSNGRGPSLSGNNSGYTQGFTLAFAGTTLTGAPMFSNLNSTGGSGNTIVAPKGVPFSFGSTMSAADIKSALDKFTVDAGGESVWHLRDYAGAINLSLGGTSPINKDLRLFQPANMPASITINDGGTYRIGGNWTVSADRFVNIVGGSAENLDVAATAVPTDTNSSPTAVGSGTVTISAAQSYTGTTTVRGTVKNALMGGGVTGPTLTVSAGGLTGTSAITVDKSAIVNLNGGTDTGASGAVVTVRDGGKLYIGSASPLRDDCTLVLAGTGGTLYNGGGGYYSGSGGAQSLVSLTVDPGFSMVNTHSAGVLTLSHATNGGYTRNTGGTVHFLGSSGSAYASFSSAPTGVSVSGTLDRAILVGASYTTAAAGGDMNDHFVKAAAGAIGAPTEDNKTDIATWAAGDNIRVGAALTNALSENLAINSFMGGLGPINLGTKTLTVNSGMIYYNGNGCMTIQGSAGATTTGVLLPGAGRDLVFMGGGSSGIHVGSQVGTAAQTVVLTVGRFEGTSNPFSRGVYLFNAGNYIGNLYIAGQSVISCVPGAIGPDNVRTAYMNGGGLLFGNGATHTYNNLALDVGPLGGSFIDGRTSNFTSEQSQDAGTGTTSTTTVGGSVTLNGVLRVGGGGNKTLTGNITGPGILLTEALPSVNNGYGRMTLSGNNSNWTGGIRFGEGFQYRLASANAAGSGPIVNHQNIGIIEFTGNTDGARALANDIVGSASTSKTIISNAKTDAAVTLSGRIYSAGGLTFQGYDSGSAVSETVLSGSVSVSGAADIYSYGDASNIQRFVNAQSGINLGVTSRANSPFINYGTAGYLDMPNGPTISNAAWAGSVATITAAGHGLTVGQSVAISGMNPVGYNGTYTVTAVAGNTFSYALTTNPGTFVSGGRADPPVMNGAEGYVRFSGANSFIPGAVGPGYLAAIRKGGSTQKAFGYLLTATNTAAGAEYVLPEGKSFVIGTLGSGATQTNGTFGAKGNGVATFLGSPKLYGAEAGDINVHGNAVGENAALNLLTDAGTTNKLGNSATNVVFTPTYGDSGATSAITLMRDRTGSTTLNKVGAGEVDVVNVAYSNVLSSASVRDTFTWNVNAGTLKYDQTDGAVANFAAFNVGGASASGTPTLSGTGSIKAAVVVSSNGVGVVAGTVNPGTAGTVGTLGVSNVTFQAGSTYTVDMGGGANNADKLQVAAAASIASGANLTLNILSSLDQGKYVIATAASGLENSSNFTVTGLPSDYRLIYSATELAVVHKADQTLVRTTPTDPVSKHANDSLAVGATLSNTAVANSADLVVSLANSNAVTLTVANLQSSSGGTVAAQAASTITGSIADVGGAGGGKTWGVKNTDANAITPVVYCGGIVNVYGLASANAITTPINLGTIHKNDSFANSALSIQNTAPDTSGYTEELNASVGSPTGNATHNSGSISLLAPQATDTSITVSLNGTDTAGSKTGTVTITLTSDGTGTSGLGTTALASQVITVNGVVYSGDGVWNVDADGNWSAPGNWTTLGGVPGLDGSFLTTDTATFGAAATSVSPQVSLNGDSPHVTAITFDNATRSYSIVQGAGAGKLNLTGGAGTSTITLTSGSHAINVETVLKSNLTVGGGGNLTVGGAITEESGPRTLTKTDGGTLTLTGASTYAGATAVNGGTLEVNGSLAGGGAAVTVASGATLGGTGTVSRAVSVDVGGFLAPALSGIGTQTVASATIPGTLAMNMDDSGAGTGQTDGLIVSGNLNATGGTLALGIVGTLNDASYTLVTFGSLTGTFTVTGLPSNYRVVYEADSIKLRKIAGGSVIIFR